MQVPEDEILQDAARDEDDATFQTGLREAVEIAKEARDHGRKRKMSPSTQPSSSTAKETEGVVKLVEEEEEEEDLATVRSGLGRRRSKRENLTSGPLEQLHLENLNMNLIDESDSASVACLSLPYIVSQYDRGSCVLHRLARAVLPPDDHLADTPAF